MIKNLLLLLSLAGLCFGSVACFILLFSNKTQKHANRLLALLLFTVAYILAVSFLFNWNPDLYAHIFRMPSPLLFILFPTAYLYTRAIKNNETALVRKDILHFVPAILYLVEMIPFYLTSYSSKLATIREINIHPHKLIVLNEGLLPSYFHIGLLCFQALAYLLVIIILLTEGKYKEKKATNIHNYKWLQIFVLSTGIIAVPMLFFFLGGESLVGTNFQFLFLTVVLSFLVINLYLFFQPETLYGIGGAKVALIDPAVTKQHSIIPENDSDFAQLIPCLEVTTSKDETESKNSISNLSSYKPVLDCYINSTRPFLKQGYTIQDLSRDTGIPQHHLSALLNRIYGVRFNDFINDLRIRFISENFGNPEWQNLTIEGIAKQAGFTSRTTFFNALKKITGSTPSEFIEQMKKRSVPVGDKKQLNYEILTS